MPLFVCDCCHAIENTALGRYWSRGIDFGNGVTDSRALCSECMPKNEFKGGVWHGKFEKLIATTELIKEMGETNFVYVSNILNVTAKNCVEVHRKIEKKLSIPAKITIAVTCAYCGNTFKAKQQTTCRKCGSTVEYKNYV